ncbi:MAG: hypothetical protein IPK31_07340 [Chitinophagaceae bacterium]|nr:hypothetical protein [Chitinophagaceae bacterium]
MKKIFTLLFAATLFTAANAQNGNRDNKQFDQRDNQNGYGKGSTVNNGRYEKDDRDNNSKRYNERKRDMQIAQINREYDYKIQKVRSSFYMNRFQKQREIRFLEDKRRMEIKKVNMQFSKGRYNDRDYDSNRHH